MQNFAWTKDIWQVFSNLLALMQWQSLYKVLFLTDGDLVKIFQAETNKKSQMDVQIDLRVVFHIEAKYHMCQTQSFNQKDVIQRNISFHMN